MSPAPVAPEPAGKVSAPEDAAGAVTSEDAAAVVSHQEVGVVDPSDTDDTFRFVLLRCPTVDPKTTGLRAVLDLRRDHHRSLAALAPSKRVFTARNLLRSSTERYQAALVSEVAASLLDRARTLGVEASSDQLLEAYTSLDKSDARKLRALLAHSLITALHAQVPPAVIRPLAEVYRLASLATGYTQGQPVKVGQFLATPIALRFGPASDAVANVANAGIAPNALKVSPAPAGRELLLAIEALEALDRPVHLTQPGPDGTAVSSGPSPFVLTQQAVAGIARTTAKLLAQQGLDPAELPLTDIISALEALLWTKVVTTHPAVTPPTAGVGGDSIGSLLSVQGDARRLVRMEQVGQHFVVRQHLKSYDPIDVADIQNVLPGETNTQTHRALERTQVTRTIESEETRESETEHETAQRTEVNRESTHAVEEQAQRHIELSLTGRYGPSVEFSSELALDSTTAEQATDQFATSFAKDVTDRTVERIGSRLRTTLVIHTESETEETNVHGLEGPEDEPFRGIYQYVDKVYEAQLFDIGARTVADFNIPEPGAFLAQQRLPRTGTSTDIPPPPLLADHLRSQSDVTELNYLALCALFGVDDPPPVPPRYRTITGTAREPGAGQPGLSEDDTPRSLDAIDLPIPEGYRPWRMRARILLLTDETPAVGLSMPGVSIFWMGDDSEPKLTDNHRIVRSPLFYADMANVLANSPTGSLLEANVLAFESANLATTLEVACRRTPAAVASWQGAVYRELLRAAERLQLAYEAELAASPPPPAPMPGGDFGISPSEAELILRDEIKRSCMTILLPPGAIAASEQTFDDDTGTAINGAVADLHARIVRFMEQSFEWENLQYVLYPYFWGRRSAWEARLRLAEEQPELKRFLQAGAARVVVPLRPGFAADMATFLASDGTVVGESAEVVPEHYVPIDQELRERAAAGPVGTVVGDPWEVRVPTRLTYVRASEDLPIWTRASPQGWSWNLVN